MNRLTTWIVADKLETSVTNISTVARDLDSTGSAAFAINRVRSLTTYHSCAALETRPEWKDREYREAYAEAAVEQSTAWQIRANRKYRGWSQDELAQRMSTHQSAVSRLEDPTYGKHSLETLVAVSAAFDCALSVKFIPYSILAAESMDLSDDTLIAKPYQAELFELEHRDVQ